MKRWAVLLVLALLGPVAEAQEQAAAEPVRFASMPAASEAHVISANEMHAPPSMRPIQAALVRSGLSRVSTRVSLIWDATGHVTGLKLDEPTGSRLLDKAILGWAAKLQLNAQEPGEGTLPLQMRLD